MDRPKRLGPYVVVRELGAGALGTVYLAEDSLSRRQVAVKVLHPHSGPTSRDRFLREVRASAKLNAAFVVPVHHADEADGLRFLVMDALTGETLHARLHRERRLPMPTALSVARQIARALAEAHALHLTHGDLAAGNVWLDPHDTARLLDWGLGRPDPDDALAERWARQPKLGYDAPETLTGEPHDAPADLFSFGCLLYRMTTGELPFPQTDAEAYARAVTFDPQLRAQLIHPGISNDLDDLIERLLAKMPGDRPTAAEALRRLDALAGLPSLPDRPLRDALPAPLLTPAVSKTWWIDAIAGVLLLLAAFGLYRWRQASVAPLTPVAVPATVEP